MSPAERARMADAYRLTLLYEVAFWEMAHGAEGWPGTDTDMAEVAGGPTWNGDPASPTESAWSHMASHTGREGTEG